MDIFFDIELIDDEVISILFLSNEGHFYAEPISGNYNIESLKYNDAVFHFESDPEHKRIELKESKEIVAKGLQNWLIGHSDKKLITYTNNPTKIKIVETISGLDLSKCTIHDMSFDEKTEIIDRLTELKNNYNGQR
jgi:hypothetical protein